MIAREPVSPDWAAFLEGAWPSLLAGGRVCAPRELPSPGLSGFRHPWMAEDRGQAVDWTLPMADGSRVHAHEYIDRSIVVHRDATDPSQGPIAAAWHVASETRFGGLVLKAAAIALGIYVGGQVGQWIGGAS
jgi:hypothetical protein